MDINSFFKQGKTVLSFEIFPPKKNKALGDIYETLNVLKDLNPDFISVTFVREAA
jgi:methylenetetrahydrofolate reductase (NADPH)